MRQHCFLTSLSIVYAYEFWHYQGPIGSRSMARRNFECFYMILIYLVDTTELWVSGNIAISLLASLTPQPARQRFRRQFKIPLDYAIKKLESNVQQPNAKSTI